MGLATSHQPPGRVEGRVSEQARAGQDTRKLRYSSICQPHKNVGPANSNVYRTTRILGGYIDY